MLQAIFACCGVSFASSLEPATSHLVSRHPYTINWFPIDLQDLKGKTSPNDATGKVEDNHAEDSTARRHQLASPCGGRDVAVANAVESDEGPPQRVPHALEVGLVVQLLLEKEDKESGEEENDGADVGG